MPKQAPETFDSERFEKLVSEYRVNFVKLAYSYVLNRDEAEDIVNDSFLYVLEHREAIVWGENMKSYVYKCVKSYCYIRLRERQRLCRAKDSISKEECWSLESSLNALQNDDITSNMFREEVSEIYYRELDKMPELTRTVYLSSRYKEMTHQQIAEAYELTPRKVTTEMKNAYVLLRVALKDYLHLFILLLASMNG